MNPPGSLLQLCCTEMCMLEEWTVALSVNALHDRLREFLFQRQRRRALAATAIPATKTQAGGRVVAQRNGRHGGVKWQKDGRATG